MVKERFMGPGITTSSLNFKVETLGFDCFRNKDAGY